MKDEGCPTCGSKNIGALEVRKDSENKPGWRMQCYNCKKTWTKSEY